MADAAVLKTAGGKPSSGFNSRARYGLESGAVQRFTQPRRPQTNGKVERFNRTRLEEWAYVRPYTSNERRTRALTTWLHIYNHHRAHTNLGQLPPISRLNNVSGHYI